MTVSIDKPSIQITVHADGVRPLVKIVNRPLVPGITSTQGDANFSLSQATDTTKKSGAFSADASVKFSMSPGDTLDDWKVGFVQIVCLRAFRTLDSEGSIVCDARHGISSRVVLDSFSQAIIPWARQPDGKSEFKGPLATPSAWDSPSIATPLFRENGQVSNVPNMLYDFSQDCEFWTILTVTGPGNSREYLAHFHWRVVHKVDFSWRDRVPVPSTWSSFKILDKFVAGPPSDADLQPVLANPAGPIANDVLTTAYVNSFKRDDFRTHSESDKWLQPMRLDFWGSDLPPDVG